MSTATYPRATENPFARHDIELRCVRCGATMLETDRVTEDGCTYIWYACSSFDCKEQWLTKKVARMM